MRARVGSGTFCAIALSAVALSAGCGEDRDDEAGTTATVVGYQNRQTKDELRAERITIDGKTTELR